jgi:glycosyltransferase involved in cell wall biosynthesis
VRPHDERLFVVRPELVGAVREHDQAARILVRPPRAANIGARIAWEHMVLPSKLTPFAPDVVFSPFNVIPVRWPAPRPGLVVMISNLAPFARECLDVCTPSEKRRNVVLRALTMHSVNHADRVIILSGQALELIDPGGSWQARAELVPQAPPPVAGLPTGDAPWPRPYVVIVADWYKFKGIESVIEAIGRVALDDRPDIVLAGRLIEPDYVASIEARVRELHLQDVVHVVGQLPHGRILELMAGARACVAPSRFENLSRVPAEAMAAGAPAIVRDTPSYREACGDAAAYFTSDEDLAALLTQAMHDGAWRERLTTLGAARVTSMSADTGAARIADVLSGLSPR